MTTRAKLLRVLAAQEVCAGVIGPVIALVELSQAGFAARLLPGAAVSLLFFSLSLFAGLTLWAARRYGYTASVVVQLAQLPKLTGPQFAFVFGLAPDIAVLLYTARAPGLGDVRGFSLSVTPSPVALVGPEPLPGARAAIGVSVLSFVWLFLLRKSPEAPSESSAPEATNEPAFGSAGGPPPPDWVMPPWMRVATLIAAALIASCCGMCTLPRLFR